jgi:hypothetical protein
VHGRGGGTVPAAGSGVACTCGQIASGDGGGGGGAATGSVGGEGVARYRGAPGGGSQARAGGRRGLAGASAAAAYGSRWRALYGRTLAVSVVFSLINTLLMQILRRRQHITETCYGGTRGVWAWARKTTVTSESGKRYVRSRSTSTEATGAQGPFTLYCTLSAVRPKP